MKKLTIDSSVIIASLLENEPRHHEAFQIWESVLSGKNMAVMPYSVFVEVVAAIRRRMETSPPVLPSNSPSSLDLICHKQ